ncbi:wall-associated receptor kinase 1-like [Miscanthus floridulus]|uniref:wall-associated receptor kinase 1-like n=1 Tax=Miscanthus floridulus TaxID=154761 RepID=UPI003459A3E0
MTSHTVLAAGLVWLGAAVVVPWLAAGESEIGGAECQRSCGGVDIPFPFGMGPDHCWLLGFEILCKDTGNGVLMPFLVTMNHRTKGKHAVVEVLNISLEQGEVKVLQPISSYCYDAASRMMVPSEWSWSLANNYSFYSTANKFTVVGCRALAYIGDTRGNNPLAMYLTGCVSMCFGGKQPDGLLPDGHPQGSQVLPGVVPPVLEHSGIDGGGGALGPCSFAVLMDSSNFTSSTSSSNNISSPEFINNNSSSAFNSSRGGKAPVVLDWSIGFDDCKTAG